MVNPICLTISSRGATLLLAIIIISALTLFGMSLVNLTLSRVSSVDLEVEKVKALYIAEAGIAKSLNELKKGIDADGDGIGVIKEAQFAEGVFEVTYNPAMFTFTSVGRVNKTQRAVQLKCVGG
ncbi:MAG: pilus assembly PilX N-terminal domain-containing protein [Candidatus Omnitrophota bacterium]